MAGNKNTKKGEATIADVAFGEAPADKESYTEAPGIKKMDGQGVREIIDDMKLGHIRKTDRKKPDNLDAIENDNINGYLTENGSEKRGYRFAKLKKLFEKFDADKDGIVTDKEIEKNLEQGVGIPHRPEAAALLKKAFLPLNKAAEKEAFAMGNIAKASGVNHSTVKQANPNEAPGMMPGVQAQSNVGNGQAAGNGANMALP